MNRHFIIFLLLLFSVHNVIGQKVSLRNGSFESKPRIGQYVSESQELYSYYLMNNWMDCGSLEFPETSQADIHGSATNYWSTGLNPQHGQSFLGLVTRSDGTYESVGQKLASPLQKDSIYQFSIHLALATTYLSHTQKNTFEKSNFDTPSIFRLLGGNFKCKPNSILAISKPIYNQDWLKYTFTFTPPVDLDYLFLQVHFDQESSFESNGNLMLDNATLKQVYVASNTIRIETPDSLPYEYIPYLKSVKEMEKVEEAEESRNKQPAITIEEKQILDYYNKARTYGLYRYIRELKPSEIKKLQSILESFQLSTSAIQKTENLLDKIAIEGYTKENLEQTKFYNNYTDWQNDIKIFIVNRNLE